MTTHSNPAFVDSAMNKLADYFDDLANGKVQVPRQSVTTSIRERIQDDDVTAYHDLLVTQTGPLFLHFLASVPGILEELSHVGVALDRYTRERRKEDDRLFTLWEVDAFDGSSARTLAKYSHGAIRTLTNSPNKANRQHFDAHADKEISAFYSGSFLQVTDDIVADSLGLAAPFRGVDYVYEMAAFQFYGRNRDEHLKFVSRFLREDGLAFFLEKLNQPDLAEYERRERVKDELHKSHYFSEAQIAWKKDAMLLQMENGQILFSDFVEAASRYFSHIYVIWNGTNFYEFVASNDEKSICRFIELLGEPFIPEGFCFESPVVRKLSYPHD
ncbi:class I SAM-dependent methyltransferase [Pseudomonas sp. TH39(2020)]|uniref:class I SAM-dependent methyltransferase n=1 Tax=Pseudomonas sp. TH39(2020) TaxID=2796349 RepID=UPI0019126E6F|nr:class I SAM-dependent methyltransferase [Pseudomonas sp. TH39(2020)]MBK5396171.1 class I SAM-dependent methyltransferase [Pseudomonas sp. TH39(2020)]